MSALTNEQLLPHILTDEVIERLDRIIVLLEWFAEQQVGHPVSSLFAPRDPFSSYQTRRRWQPIDQNSGDSEPSQD